MLLSQPAGEISWRDSRLRDAYALAALAALIFCCAWPRVIVNGDEMFYAGQANLLAHGRVVPLVGDRILWSSQNPVQLLHFPPGWPALLALPSMLGFRAMFVVSLIVYLVGGLLVARMLVRRSLPALGAVAYFAHPVFWPFARTLMSDLPAAVLVLAAMDQWEQRHAARGAALAGLAPLIRIAGNFVALGFGLALFPELLRRRGAIVSLCASGAGALGLAMLTHHATHGTWIHDQYADHDRDMLRLSNLPTGAVLYGAGLALIPPFPLVWIVGRLRGCDRWVVAAIPTTLFFAAYGYHDKSASLLETLLGGQRLILTAHAILLVATARAWAVPILFRWRVLPYAAMAVALTIGLVATEHLARRYEPAVDLLRKCKTAIFGYTGDGYKVALAVDAQRYDLIEDREPSSDDGVVVYAANNPTNRGVVGTWSDLQPQKWFARAHGCAQRGEFLLVDMNGVCPSSELTVCPVRATEAVPAGNENIISNGG